MPFVSEIIGRRIADVDGRTIGSVIDLIAHQSKDLPHPMITALKGRFLSEERIISISNCAVLIAPAISLKCHLEDIKPYKIRQFDIQLVGDILDKQIIDTNGVRVVRVNDLELARVNGNYFIANVDISSMGLMRRMGLIKVARWFFRISHKTPNLTMISWDAVELLSGEEAVRLKVPSEKITDLHPADLAEIISDLSRHQTGKLLSKLDVKHLADTLEEVEPDFQASLVEEMPDERVADVLEEMAPDEAADLLAELPENRSEDILKLMQRDEANDVRKLLTYDEDEAGGIMTTDFVTVPISLIAEQAIQHLRKTAEDSDTIYYVYVTDRNKKLLGVFSLSDLVLANPKTPVSDFMHRRVKSVRLKDSQEKVAQAIAKYDLLSIPVVDDHGRIHGIVTSDDALDRIIPTAWKKKIPRFYR